MQARLRRASRGGAAPFGHPRSYFYKDKMDGEMGNIDIRQLTSEDFELFLHVEDGLFDDPINPVQAKAFLADPLHELVLAYDGPKAVGMVSSNVQLHPDKEPSMFINEVGTRDGWTRRGIATALVESMINIARARGCDGIWLGTEQDNLPAIGLYRSLEAEEVAGVYFGWDGAFEEE